MDVLSSIKEKFSKISEYRKKLKERLAAFKETKKSNMIFLFCAVFPFFLTDIILRYVLNFIIVYDIKYYLVPIMFNVFWIFGLVYLCYGILPKTLGKILYTIIYLFFGIWFFANYIYFCIFEQYMWMRVIFLAGEGMDYASEIFNHINIFVILLVIVYIAFLVVTLILWKKPVYEKKREKYILGIIPFILLFYLHGGIMIDTKIQIANGAWEVWERPVLVYKHFTDANKSLNVCGFYQFTFKSIYRMIFNTTAYTQEDINECDNYFAKKREIPDNEMTGILKDKNVIFVLMESMDDWLITEEYTPTIKYMMDNGINFTNHYMPNMGTGFTFNSEFAMNTGFQCPASSSSASTYTSNTFEFAMPNLFAKDGYNVNSFHFNDKNYYNRNSMHIKFGYKNYYSLKDYMPYEQSIMDSEIVKNDEVYNLMTDGKFFSFFISYSAHLPYDEIDDKYQGIISKYPELSDPNLSGEIRNIFLFAHDTDEFFRILIERLKADGIYENTVIIGVTDHLAYGIENKDLLEQYSIDAGSNIQEKVPFFIFCPSIEPMQVTKVTGAIDIVPTITNMFGIKSEYCLGNDAFDPSYKGFVHFPDGSWYDGEIFYVPGTDYSSLSAEEQNYITQTSKDIIHMNDINDCIVNTDYFKNIND